MHSALAKMGWKGRSSAGFSINSHQQMFTNGQTGDAFGALGKQERLQKTTSTSIVCEHGFTIITLQVTQCSLRPISCCHVLSLILAEMRPLRHHIIKPLSLGGTSARRARAGHLL